MFLLVTTVLSLTDLPPLNVLFDKENDTPYFIMISSNRCPHCVNAKPDFIEAEKLADGLAKFVYTEDEEIKRALRIMSVPAFCLFYKGEVSSYYNIRRARNFVDFIGNTVGAHVPIVDSTWIKSEKKIILFAPNRFKAPPILSAAFVNYKDQGIRIGLANSKSVIAEFNITRTPSIWFFNGNSSMHYLGRQEITNLKDKINRFFTQTQNEVDDL